ncbi:hypothetical protein GJ744_010321 [Endocarpon pusillum]|uniref:Uncharacterized protein n=1 Tax=Endocarpon pusillum TaxID=364733 RepID=A0A8H7ALZ1_9EURO|nr:hypothetical protein GJ744_010321 [Endocarpon pusillum]
MKERYIILPNASPYAGCRTELDGVLNINNGTQPRIQHFTLPTSHPDLRRNPDSTASSRKAVQHSTIAIPHTSANGPPCKPPS